MVLLDSFGSVHLWIF